ncbi:unnamed protein product [Meloidogyne enterolobii]|uniref:Uncharacterized protein n=1 Tax=Meloidogyne enterolobii TaxID=390850 RepID=A0ACB0YIH4_MELEN
MENELKIKSRESIRIYRLFEIWKERKIYLKSKYDKILDFELKRIEEIKKEENYLVEMEFGLKKLVEDEMESEENFFDIGNLIKQKWIKIEENGGGGKFNEEEKIKFNEWIKGQNWEIIKIIIRNNEIFKKQINIGGKGYLIEMNFLSILLSNLQEEYEIRLKFVDLIGIKGVKEFYELSKIKFNPKDFGLEDEEIMKIEEVKKKDEEVDKKEEEEGKELIKGKTKMLEKSKKLSVYEEKNKKGKNLKNKNKKSEHDREENREDKEDKNEEKEENEEESEENREKEEEEEEEHQTKNIQEGEPLEETKIIDKYGKRPMEELEKEEENKQENTDIPSSNPSSSSPPSKIILPIYFLKNDYLNDFYKELKNQNEENNCLLNVGILINEIGRKMRPIKKYKKIKGWPNYKLINYLKNKWEFMLNGVFLKEINNCEKLKNKLELFLKELIEWENDRIENNSVRFFNKINFEKCREFK